MPTRVSDWATERLLRLSRSNFSSDAFALHSLNLGISDNYATWDQSQLKQWLQDNHVPVPNNANLAQLREAVQTHIQAGTSPMALATATVSGHQAIDTSLEMFALTFSSPLISRRLCATPLCRSEGQCALGLVRIGIEKVPSVKGYRLTSFEEGRARIAGQAAWCFGQSRFRRCHQHCCFSC